MNQKQGKGAPKPQNQGQSQGLATQENLPKPQAKSNIAKPKKEARKWCKFHKSPTHNTCECRAKQSLVAEIKASESDTYSDTESEPKKGNDKGKKIIDAEPNDIVATTKIQKEELEDSDGEEHIFHSLVVSLILWFRGTFPFLLIRISKVSLFLFEFLLNFGSIPICHTKRGDVEELHFLLNVSMQTTAVL